MDILSNSSKFFTQVISLNGAIRSDKLIKLLNKQNIEFVVTNGVLISEEDFISERFHHKKLSRLITRREISRGEVGCALAHKQAAKNFLASQFSCGIIFEDDAEINSNLNLNAVYAFLNNPMPRIFFFGWLPGFAVSKSELKNESTKTIALITPPTCAFAYGINKPAAELISNFSERILDLADWPIQVFRNVEFGACITPCVSAPQDPALSTIGSRIQSTNPLTLPIFRAISLLLSVFVVYIKGKRNKLDLTLKQIMHRMIIKDIVYKNGKKSLSEVDDPNKVVFLHSSFSNIILNYLIKWR